MAAPRCVELSERYEIQHESSVGQFSQKDNEMSYLDEPHSLISERDEPLTQFEDLPRGLVRGQEDADYKKD